MGLFSKTKKIDPSTPIIPPRWTPFAGHVYEAKRLPDPGVQNYAYENLGLVEFTFIGPAIHNRRVINPLQPTPLYSMKAVGIAGLGGLQNGQIIFQPLIDPNNPVV